MRLWVDYMAGCDAPFFNSIFTNMPLDTPYSLYNTVRKHAETISLLKAYAINADVVGEHNISNRLSQIYSFISRVAVLSYTVPDFDFSLSLANIYSIIVSAIRARPSISVIDNDLIEYERTIMEKVAARIHANATWILAPKAYPINLTMDKSAHPEKIFTFDGFKEDIYIANYEIDKTFYEKIPYHEYVVVRPEALYSTYVHNHKSITNELLNTLTESGINVIYLPRTQRDYDYIVNIKNQSKLWIPPNPLKGLDLVYHSKGVLTGSGTFAREAACMGQTAVSFFPDKLLAVDKALIDEGKMFHSRDPKKIATYISSNLNHHQSISFERSKNVKMQFIQILKLILEKDKSL